MAIFNGLSTKAMMDGSSSHCQLDTETYNHLKDSCQSDEHSAVVTLGNGLKYITKSLVLLVPVTLWNGSLTQTFDFPFVRSTSLLSGQRNYKSSSTSNLASGKFPAAPEDRDKTSFACEFGFFRYLRMPFGLKGALSTFQLAMDSFAD